MSAVDVGERQIGQTTHLIDLPTDGSRISRNRLAPKHQRLGLAAIVLVRDERPDGC